MRYFQPFCGHIWWTKRECPKSGEEHWCLFEAHSPVGKFRHKIHRCRCGATIKKSLMETGT